MTDVNEIIRITEEKSNDIDIFATIKNSFENFYTEELAYPLVEKSMYFMPMGNILYNIKDENYVFDGIDEIFIKEVEKQLTEGIFLSMAIVEFKNDICYIKSINTYEYAPKNLGFSSFDDIKVYTWESENLQIIDESRYEYMALDNEGNRIHITKYYNNIYGLFFKKEDEKLKVRYCGDTSSGFKPLFYTFESLNEEEQIDYQFNTSNPIVQKVVEAIYNGIIFK